ncbi:PHKB [Cordylochernes scorpioides]|uniref:Phosphorylase b kinase regulatory subunit n=1 Tax=Cordylochernes scorpioides TaxID=51811 RepID=A0ABY6K335_9ARAC|nr:PHKB [Cordylochernes scorpioides]
MNTCILHLQNLIISSYIFMEPQLPVKALCPVHGGSGRPLGGGHRPPPDPEGGEGDDLPAVPAPRHLPGRAAAGDHALRGQAHLHPPPALPGGVENQSGRLESLSPSELRKALYQVLLLSEQQNANNNVSPHQFRQIEGALCRVPKDFYDKVWEILTRTPGGINVADQLLPQHPTLTEMTVYDLNFALKVEQLLTRIKHPEYLHIIVELLMVIHLILKRNPELSFEAPINLDQMFKEALSLFQKDHHQVKAEDTAQFYNSPPSGHRPLPRPCGDEPALLLLQ